ncbi:hypothetical protein QBC43DRAFT_290515 [Cladorrhinum sp. PSN259]|nr:hypothetical protein QBC43DRAFT_290515 [Cladorrhinum sp. PSN259]
MDWPAVSEPFLTDDDIKDFFQYDFELLDDTDPCLALGDFHQNELIWNDVETDEEWTQWLKMPNDNRIVYSIAKFVRLTSPVEAQMMGIPNPHTYLPLSEDRWRRIAKSFSLGRAIRKAMEDNKTYSGFMIRRGVDRDPEELETLEMFTAVITSTDKLYNVSLSSTYFTKAQLSLAVIFNCDNDQKNLIYRILKASPEVSNHPLLMLGVYAELQRDRMERLVKGVHGARDKLMTSLNMEKGQVSRAAVLTWQASCDFREAIAQAKEAEEVIRDTKRQIEKITKHIGDKSEAKKQELFKEATSRFECRFEDICIELEGLMSLCKIVAEDLIYTGGLFMGETSRQNTIKAGLQATVIAFLAMLYLPMTSIATIFAMPAFQFQNRWWDMAFRYSPPHTNGTSPSGNSNGGNGKSRDDIASGYFTIYLFVSAFFTYATLRFHFWYTLELQPPFFSGTWWWLPVLGQWRWFFYFWRSPTEFPFWHWRRWWPILVPDLDEEEETHEGKVRGRRAPSGDAENHEDTPAARKNSTDSKMSGAGSQGTGTQGSSSRDQGRSSSEDQGRVRVSEEGGILTQGEDGDGDNLNSDGTTNIRNRGWRSILPGTGGHKVASGDEERGKPNPPPLSQDKDSERSGIEMQSMSGDGRK